MIKRKVKEHDKREKSLGDGECRHKEVVVVLFVLFCVDWSGTPTSILWRQRDHIGTCKRHSCLGEESAVHSDGVTDSD